MTADADRGAQGGASRLTIEQRIARLEHIAVMLAHEASHGQGSLGKSFWDFIDTINGEHGRVLPPRPHVFDYFDSEAADNA